MGFGPANFATPTTPAPLTTPVTPATPDIMLVCMIKRCRKRFLFMRGERDFYASKGRKAPRCCKECRLRLAAKGKSCDFSSCTASTVDVSSSSGESETFKCELLSVKKVVKQVGEEGTDPTVMVLEMDTKTQ